MKKYFTLRALRCRPLHSWQPLSLPLIVFHHQFLSLLRFVVVVVALFQINIIHPSFTRSHQMNSAFRRNRTVNTLRRTFSPEVTQSYSVYIICRTSFASPAHECGGATAAAVCASLHCRFIHADKFNSILLLFVIFTVWHCFCICRSNNSQRFLFARIFPLTFPARYNRFDWMDRHGIECTAGAQRQQTIYE